jgi:hypothetical protein
VRKQDYQGTSVANVSLIVVLDKQHLTMRVRKVPPRSLQLILAGTDTVLGHRCAFAPKRWLGQFWDSALVTLRDIK